MWSSDDWSSANKLLIYDFKIQQTLSERLFVIATTSNGTVLCKNMYIDYMKMTCLYLK